MAHQAEQSRKKGFFGRIGFPVAAKYPAAKSRYFLYFVGGIGVAVIGLTFAVKAAFTSESVLAGGPLTSHHATIGADCASCHTSFEGVSDQKCMVCHEKFGDDLGTYSFDAHYVYRSGDYGRVVPTSGDESTCASCHPEHEGREAIVTHVADAQCQQCHEVDRFEKDHPEFQFIREELIDEANLVFPHTLHVNELQRKEKLADIEKACLYCHNAEEDGKGFQDIEFDAHCDACHLSSSTATPFLNLARGTTPGVQNLTQIQQTAAPGSRWSYYINPNEFQTRGATIRKRPVYHEDPWILANLRAIRNTLYPSSNLSSLLNTSADVAPQNADRLYEEAIETLRSYAEDLRNQPNRQVQTELTKSEELLTSIERRLADPLESRDETQFIVSAASLNERLSEEDFQTYEQLVASLTEPCQTCHLVEKATIKRVQTTQQTLLRSEFDHRAHIIQARCLDCHNTIPIKELAGSDSIPPVTVDRAELYNLPAIANCQSCHSNNLASNTCITCHEFHPDKSQHANLLLYVD